MSGPNPEFQPSPLEADDDIIVSMLDFVNRIGRNGLARRKREPSVHDDDIRIHFSVETTLSAARLEPEVSLEDAPTVSFPVIRLAPELIQEIEERFGDGL